MGRSAIKNGDLKVGLSLAVYGRFKLTETILMMIPPANLPTMLSATLAATPTRGRVTARHGDLIYTKRLHKKLSQSVSKKLTQKQR